MTGSPMTSVLNVDLAADEILKPDLFRLRHAEADDRPLAGLDPASASSARQRAAGAVVLRRSAGREIGLAVGVELLRRAEAVVRVIARQQLVGVRRVEMQPLGLAIGTVRAADVRPLVPVEPEPAQVLEDALLRLARRSLGVGVLDAEDERAVLAVRQQPVEERRARVADVQLAGRAGSESDAHTSVGSRQSTVGSHSRQSQSAVTVVSRQTQVSRATACAAIASPRPTASTPSFVLPLTLTRPASMPRRRRARARIASRCGPIFGRSRMTTTSTFATAKPGRGRGAATSREQLDARRALPPRIGVGIVLPDVAGPAAPRIASVTA